MSASPTALGARLGEMIRMLASCAVRVCVWPIESRSCLGRVWRRAGRCACVRCLQSAGTRVVTSAVSFLLPCVVWAALPLGRWGLGSRVWHMYTQMRKVTKVKIHFTFVTHRSSSWHYRLFVRAGRSTLDIVSCHRLVHLIMHRPQLSLAQPLLRVHQSRREPCGGESGVRSSFGSIAR